MCKKDVAKREGVIVLCLYVTALAVGLLYSFYSVYTVNSYFKFVIKCMGCE